MPVLLACGVGLIGAGAVLLAYFQSLVSSPSQNSMPQSFYYYAQVISYGAPVLICLGLATLIGVLFVHAVRWKPSA